MWKRFFFDGNQWSGHVNGPDDWAALSAAYATWGGAAHLAKAKVALGHATDQDPNFGFRREHRGDLTLEVWAAREGMTEALFTAAPKPWRLRRPDGTDRLDRWGAPATFATRADAERALRTMAPDHRESAVPMLVEGNHRQRALALIEALVTPAFEVYAAELSKIVGPAGADDDGSINHRLLTDLVWVERVSGELVALAKRLKEVTE